MILAFHITNLSIGVALSVVDELGLMNQIDPKGCFRLIPDETADKAIVNGKLVYDDYNSSIRNKAVQEHSFVLVTPRITTRDKTTIEQAVTLLNLLYNEGAVIISPLSVKIHFDGTYSGVKARAISRRIVPRNKLLYLMYLSYWVPFWSPDGEVSDTAYYVYRSLVDCWSCNTRQLRGLTKDIAALMYSDGNMIPDEESGKYKSRFDRDSSPDSEN